MARVQTRKSASLAAGVYAITKEHAEARSISVSQLIEDALRAYGIPVPRGVHLDKATRSVVRPDREPVIETRLDLVTDDSFDRGETCSCADLDAMAAQRRSPRAGDPAPHAKTCAWGVTCKGPFVLSTYDDKLVPACAMHAEEEDGERTDRTWKRRTSDLKAGGVV